MPLPTSAEYPSRKARASLSSTFPNPCRSLPYLPSLAVLGKQMRFFAEMSHEDRVVYASVTAISVALIVVLVILLF